MNATLNRMVNDSTISVTSWALLEMFGCTAVRAHYIWLGVRCTYFGSPRSQSRYYFFLCPFETSKSGKMGKRTCTMKIRSDNENRCCLNGSSLEEVYTQPHTTYYTHTIQIEKHTFVMWKCIIISWVFASCEGHLIHPTSLCCVQSNSTTVCSNVCSRNK